MKQTAVEWLCEQYHLKQDIEIVKQAKEMEKEQQGYSLDDLKEAFSMGKVGKTIRDFNEQFKKK